MPFEVSENLFRKEVNKTLLVMVDLPGLKPYCMSIIMEFKLLLTQGNTRDFNSLARW